MSLRRPAVFLVLCFVVPELLPASPTDSLRTVYKPRFAQNVHRSPGFVASGTVRRAGIAIVLSGGGARGLSSIGVIKSLEKHGIPIDLIVGTSIGSIVGGLYASGYTTPDLERIALTTNWREVLSYDDDARRRDMFLDQKLATDRSLVVLRFDGLSPVFPAAYSTGQRLTNYLNLLVLQGRYRPGPSFDALRVPFRAVTTDLISGRPFVFREGDLSVALRASVAVPLLFSAVKKDTMELMDGGLISNMPVDVALQEGAECVVVVDVTSPLRPAHQVVAPWEIGEQIMGIMMQSANAEARAKADVVVRPDLGDHVSSDFTGIQALIDAGEAAGDEAVPAIRNALQQRSTRSATVPYYRHRIRSGGDPLPPEAEGVIEVFRSQDSITGTDIQDLVDALHQTGDFSDVLAEVTASGPGDISIGLTVVRHSVLKDVSVEGASEIDPDSVKALFEPLIGHPLNAVRSSETLDAVIGIYRDRGYSLARVAAVAFDPASGVATVRVDEGHIARMTIRGTSKTRDYVIWRELPFREGDVFNVRQAAEGLANMYATNLFEQASMTVERESPDARQHLLVINVRERYTELVRLGLRVDNERSFQPWIDVRDENFLGAGAEIGLTVGGGPRNQSTIAELRAVRIFDSYLTARLQGYMLLKDVNTFTEASGLSVTRFDRLRTGEIREVRRGGLLGFGTQLERLGDVWIEGRLERHNVYNIFAQPITNQDYDISSIRFGTRVDTQDKVPYPRQGVNLAFQYETALVRVSESIGFTKLSFSYESFETYGDRHTIHPKFMFGLGDDAVPTSEQFTLGGQQSFFGFREDDARGRQIMVGSLEYLYRFPLTAATDVHLSVRYDVGSVWLRAEEIRLIDLRHAVGLAVGFDTPVGPVDLAIGRSFYIRRDLLDRPLALGPLLAYFSIGYRLR